MTVSHHAPRSSAYSIGSLTHQEFDLPFHTPSSVGSPQGCLQVCCSVPRPVQFLLHQLDPGSPHVCSSACHSEAGICCCQFLLQALHMSEVRWAAFTRVHSEACSSCSLLTPQGLAADASPEQPSQQHTAHQPWHCPCPSLRRVRQWHSQAWLLGPIRLQRGIFPGPALAAKSRAPRKDTLPEVVEVIVSILRASM